MGEKWTEYQEGIIRFQILKRFYILNRVNPTEITNPKIRSIRSGRVWDFPQILTPTPNLKVNLSHQEGVPIKTMSSPKDDTKDKQPKKQQHLQVDRSSTFVYDLILWILARILLFTAVTSNSLNSHGGYLLSRNPKSRELSDPETWCSNFCGGTSR
jgi:hypothetical protein